MHIYIIYIYIYIYTLKGLAPMPRTRTLNASRPPDRFQVTSRCPRNQPRNQPIVKENCVWTIGMLGEVMAG